MGSTQNTTTGRTGKRALVALGGATLIGAIAVGTWVAVGHGGSGHPQAQGSALTVNGAMVRSDYSALSLRPNMLTALRGRANLLNAATQAQPNLRSSLRIDANALALYRSSSALAIVHSASMNGSSLHALNGAIGGFGHLITGQASGSALQFASGESLNAAGLTPASISAIGSAALRHAATMAWAQPQSISFSTAGSSLLTRAAFTHFSGMQGEARILVTGTNGAGSALQQAAQGVSFSL